MTAKDAVPPTSDLPSDVQRQSAATCVPDDFYYDTKHLPHRTDADWARVRACAFAKDDVGVLMMLYANGYGVKRSPAIAVRFACLLGGAPAEEKMRVFHLSTMDGKDGGAEFDICDDATSGFMAGYCTHIEDRQRAQERAKVLAKYAQKLNGRERSAFEQLQTALSAFAQRRGDSETDMMGTARAALAIQASVDEYDAFMSLLGKVEAGTLEKSDTARVNDLNQEMDRVLHKVRLSKGVEADSSGRIGYTTITKANVVEAQRAWLQYRDAWIHFIGTHRTPDIDTDSLAAHLTTRRVEQLRTLLEEAQ
ncbi:lysozyme inhibitor LprI family protein [Ralstonia chuxiongensis]|uniref:Lysozyme inhibitor LprI family protein n=1 Tax=Ralstonia chuxiongensis TaxID=2957504 RepID=A0AA42BJQ6_9RALS|nr:lysozyme inhibitor LprI family protein [Ralstonia chuxiongensis]MCP1174328.1 lysozyme inhibitor LprI family protein [Ralstonia chuxiongensis]